MDCIFALDAGGTYLKYALMDENGNAIPRTQGQAPSHADGTKEEIGQAFTKVGCYALEQAKLCGLTLKGIAISFPGPFDYDQGISHMAHKYAAINGVSITPMVKAGAGDVPIDYLHDSTAFLLGEYAKGAAANFQRPAGVMLGTGLGFAAMVSGRVLVQPDQRPRVVLWNKPYQDGISEDYISRRAILKAYGNQPGMDVKDIAERALAGEEKAKTVFLDLAFHMGQILAPVIKNLAADCLVVGGQIAKSGKLFLPQVEACLQIPVRQAQLIENGALYGAWYHGKMGRENCVQG